MEEQFEIGQKVKWTIGSQIIKGIFIEEKEDGSGLSSVRCYGRSWIDHPDYIEKSVQTVDVLTSLLEKDQ